MTWGTLSNPQPDPTAAPDVAGEVRCGDVAIPIVFDGASGLIAIGLSESEIRDLFTPALKS